MACEATTVKINGTAYALSPLDPGEDHTAAYRLEKRDGTVYDVCRTRDGLVVCDCADYEYRRRGLTRTPCKHGAALVALGLVAAPGPSATACPEPDECDLAEMLDERAEAEPIPPPADPDPDSPADPDGWGEAWYRELVEAWEVPAADDPGDAGDYTEPTAEDRAEWAQASGELADIQEMRDYYAANRDKHAAWYDEIRRMEG